MRWSGARCGVLIPVRPGAGHTVRLSLSIPGARWTERHQCCAFDGKALNTIAQPGRQEFDLRLPARPSSSGLVARLEFHASGWKPSETQAGSRDERELGFSLRQVEVYRDGAKQDAPAEATLGYEAVAAALQSLTRSVGAGRTILLRGESADPTTVAVVVASVTPGLPDGQLDGRFATLTESGVLWFDGNSPRIERKPRP